MKKLMIYFICSLILIQLFGCVDEKSVYTEELVLDGRNPAEQSKSTLSKRKITIALVMKTLANPFFNNMEKGARKAAEEYGINLIVRTGAQETSIEQQISIVEELINIKVDAIVIAPGHSTDLIPILKKAQDAKIAIVNVDNRLNPEVSEKMGLVNVPFISVDNEQGAYLSTKYICDKIKKPAKAVILEGIRGADNSEQRKKGSIKAFDESKNIKLVAVETANWKIDEAFTVISEVFDKYPDISAVFCANDMMALGVIEFLSQKNRNDVLVAGFDALEEAKEAIMDGKMQVSINQQADVQGYTGVVYALRMLQSKKIPPETYIPVELVDQNLLN